MIFDIKCGTGGPPSNHSYMTNFGLALQQVGNRSFDVYLGLQKVFGLEPDFRRASRSRT